MNVSLRLQPIFIGKMKKKAFDDILIHTAGSIFLNLLLRERAISINIAHGTAASVAPINSKFSKNFESKWQARTINLFAFGFFVAAKNIYI